MTLSGKLSATAAALICVLAAPAHAQDREGPIVVIGQSEPVIIRQAQRQARDIAVRTGNAADSPLARFEDGLCPGITGLEREAAALMIDRIRDTANALDIRILHDGCSPNFIVAFVADGEAMLRGMQESSPELFQYLDSGQKRDMLEPGPVHVWSTIEPRTLTGMPIGQSRELMSPPVMRVAGAHTRIYTTMRNDITAALVAFDREAIIGLNLGQLADYATMRGLAQTRPAGDLAIDTILTLFELDREDPDWAPPQQLTDFDRAYLQALYAELPNLPAARKLSQVGFELRRLVEGEDDTAP